MSQTLIWFRNSYTKNILIVGFLIFSFFSCPVIAQNLPVSTKAGSEASRFKKEIEEEKKRIEREKPMSPSIKVEERPVLKKEGVVFLLKEVIITGSTIFSKEDFYPNYEKYLGKEVTFSELEEIVEQIKALYRKKGYLTTDVYIPEQDVIEGRIELRVIEGKLGKITIEADRWFSSALIRKYIHLKENQLLNVFTLQQDLLRLNQNPDLEVTAVLSSGQQPQTTDITLKVKEQFPYHIGTSFDNHGTRLSGKYRRSFFARSTNLTGKFDSCAFNVMSSKDAKGYFVSYVFPTDSYGTRAGLDLTVFDSKVGKEYRYQDITSSTRIGTPHITKEIILTAETEGYFDVGMDIVSVKKKEQKETTINDQLRLLFFSLDLSKIDRFGPGGQTSFSPRLTVSLEDILGASERGHASASRPSSAGSFLKYEQSLQRVQKTSAQTYLWLRSKAQWASRTLPSSEQFQLGGVYSVRGYPEGDYLADIGAYLNLEWLFFFPFIPDDIRLKGARMPLRNQLQPLIFCDIGAGKLKHTDEVEKSQKFLAAAGMGLRFQFNRNFFLRLDWAEHVGDRPSPSQGSSTFHFSLHFEL
ncbi:MAG: BamA/TamA family outer membrane protein [Candidatus Omnitrophica bacterium]|nr:BamA/TamA family outer membrane protein [Candidatus Omnitrophota bacterium]